MKYTLVNFNELSGYLVEISFNEIYIVEDLIIKSFMNV